MSDITQILSQINSGDPTSAGKLLSLVYEELRKLAAGHMAREAPGHTLEATALVHEAYLRLIRPAGSTTFANRAHFFAAAAEAMRRILVDSARRKQSLKRGGGHGPIAFSPEFIPAPLFDADSWLDLDEAVTAFEAEDATAAALAKLRIYGGLSIEEAGESLGIPRATAFRIWTYARAWLTASLADRPEKS